MKQLSSLIIVGIFGLMYVWYRGHLRSEPVSQQPAVEHQAETAKEIEEAPDVEKAVEEATEGAVAFDDSHDDVEVVNISRVNVKQRNTFGDSYNLLTELDLSKTPKTYQIKLDEEVSNLISLLVVGGEGESEVVFLKLNGSDKECEAPKGQYFQDDWKRVENFQEPLREVKLRAISKGNYSKLKVFLQKGEE